MVCLHSTEKQWVWSLADGETALSSCKAVSLSEAFQLLLLFRLHALHSILPAHAMRLLVQHTEDFKPL